MFFVSSVQMTYAQYLKKIWDDVIKHSEDQELQVLTYDFDEDGNDELITLTKNFNLPTQISIGKYEDMSYSGVSFSNNYQNPAIFNIAAGKVNGDHYVFAVLNGGKILTFNKNLEEVNRFNSNMNGVTSIKNVDIDHDGNSELLVLTTGRLKIFNLPDFSVRYDSQILGGQQLISGDCNGDGIMDICINSENDKSYVINGSDFTIIWSNINGFGKNVQFVDYDSDGKSELLAFDGNSTFNLFDVNSKTSIKTINSTVEVRNWLVDDYFKDGKYKIILTDKYDKVYLNDINTNIQKFYIDAIHYYYGPDELVIINKKYDHKKLAFFHYEVDIYDLLAGVLEYTSETLYPKTLSTQLNNRDGYLYRYEYQKGFKKLSFPELQEEKNYIFPFYEKLYAPKIIQSRSDAESELLHLTGNKLFIYDAITMDTLFAVTFDLIEYVNESNIYLLEDLNFNGFPEILLMRNSHPPYFIEFDGTKYQLYNQPNTSTGYNCLAFNHDDDIQLELGGFTNIVLYVTDSLPQINHLAATYIYADRGDKNTVLYTDIDGTGSKKLVTVVDTTLFILDRKNFSLLNTIKIPKYQRFIGIANLDDSPQQEIIVVDTALKVYNLNSELLFVSDYIGPAADWIYFNSQICDLGNDQHTDIIINYYYKSYIFSAEKASPDLTPPVVTRYNIQNRSNMVPINLPIKVTFSESILSESVSEQQFKAFTGLDSIPIRVSLDNNIILIKPVTNWPENSEISILIPNSLSDEAGNYFDGNRDSHGSHSAQDNFFVSFHTATFRDSVGPIIQALTVNTVRPYINATIKLSGTAIDTLTFPNSSITQIEYFIDDIGIGGAGNQIPSSSLYRNKPTASFQYDVTINHLSIGYHVLYIHGKDAANNWGQFESIPFTIVKEKEDDWPTYGHDEQHTFCNPYTDIGSNIILNWSKYFPDLKSINPPIIGNNNLYITYANQFNQNFIAGYELSTGNKLWEKQLSSKYVVNQIAYMQGSIFYFEPATNTSAILKCINAVDGSDIWSYHAGKINIQSFVPLIDNGYIYIPDSSRFISCIDASTGSLKWNKYFNSFSYCQFTTGDSSIYSSVGGYIYSNNKAHGGPIWNKRYSNYNDSKSLFSIPALDRQNHILVIPEGKRIFGVNLQDKLIQWSYPSNSTKNFALANSLIFSVNGTYVEKRKVQTSELMKARRLRTESEFPPLLTRDHIFISGSDSTWILDTANLNIVSSIYASGFLISNSDYLAVCSPSGKEIKVYKKNPLSAHSNPLGIIARLFPTICDNKINIEIENLISGNKVNINVLDLKGNQLSSFISPVYNNELYFQLNTSYLALGSYVIQIVQGESNQTLKFIKQ